MELIGFFKKVISVLEKSTADYALAGGMVASVYRTNERTTNDLDFLICAGKESRKKADAIIRRFHLVPHIVRKAELEGGPMFAIKSWKTTPYIILGRAEGDQGAIGLDFILPEMPWFDEAIQRARHNRIDFGFGAIPCLTKEDVILSKLYSLKNDPSRFNDLDDLKSIFQAGHDIDAAYLCGRMHTLALVVPDSLKETAPKPLLLTSKRVRREMRRIYSTSNRTIS